MIYLGFYLITCLCFTPIINKVFDGIENYGFLSLLFLTVCWPFFFLFLALYIMFNKVLDFFEDCNDRS